MKTSDPNRFSIRLPRAELTAFGRALRNGIAASQLGDVTLVFTGGTLSINTEWGGTTMRYEGDYNGVIVLKGGSFRNLIWAHVKDKKVTEWINGGVDPVLGEFALENAGVKARFLK